MAKFKQVPQTFIYSKLLEYFGKQHRFLGDEYFGFLRFSFL